MGVEVLERAAAAATPVIDGVAPGQYELSTPCKSWTVADLLGHIAGAQRMFATATGVDAAPPTDDLAVACHGAVAASLAAFRADGVMEQTFELPLGRLPGATLVNFAATDLFVHAWDVAKATGQSTDLDPVLAEQLLATLHQTLQPSFRGPDGQGAFGFEQTAPAGACAADRLAAFTGRVV